MESLAVVRENMSCRSRPLQVRNEGSRQSSIQGNQFSGRIVTLVSTAVAKVTARNSSDSTLIKRRSVRAVRARTFGS